MADNAVEVFRRFRTMLRANTLHITQRERDGLEELGWDPKELVLIERQESRSIFAKLTISGPICLYRKDGGGK